MGYANSAMKLITKICSTDLFAWEKNNYPIAYNYLVRNHPNISSNDIPSVLNTYLGPRGLRVITDAEDLNETYTDLELFLRQDIVLNDLLGYRI